MEETFTIFEHAVVRLSRIASFGTLQGITRDTMIPGVIRLDWVQVPNDRRSLSEGDIRCSIRKRLIAPRRGGRRFGHVYHKRSSFPLDESRYTLVQGYEFIRLASTEADGVVDYFHRSEESKALGKAEQKRLQSFPFASALNSISKLCPSFLTFDIRYYVLVCVETRLLLSFPHRSEILHLTPCVSLNALQHCPLLDPYFLRFTLFQCDICPCV